jgi:hypothetical protein
VSPRLARVCTLACGAALGALTLVTPAQGAEGAWQGGARLGVAWLSDAGVGPALEGYLRRGLGESLDLDLQVLASIHPFQADSKSSSGTAAPDSSGNGASSSPWGLGIVPGLTYRWDVFRVVPYVGAGLGFYSWHFYSPSVSSEPVSGASSGNTASKSSAERALEGGLFGVSVRLGLDYLLNRDVVLSVQASAHVVNAESVVRVPWIQIGIGAAHAWGW